MALKELFNGIAIIIDDEIDENNANINKIIEQILKNGTPVLKFKEIPENKVIENFNCISFLLLDWKLLPEELHVESSTDDGIVHLPDEISKEKENENIEFIKKINKNYFCPIFIFTNEHTSDIEQILKDNQIYVDKDSNIFIKNKKELETDGHLFEAITNWLEQTPSIYVLKKWESEYNKNKIKMFYDFQSISPIWPCIMWQTFKDDGVNQSIELGELISKNINSRMKPFEFDKEILEKRDISSITKEDLRKVLEGERFLKSEYLNEDDIGTGDVFKEEYEESGERKSRYYINIRAQCDLLRNNTVELYCLKGRKFAPTEGNNFYNGQYLEKINHSIVAFIDNGEIIEFLFRDIIIKKWNDEFKNKRIGRLLPPYITSIQQRYSLYLQRQGLPRIPNEAIH